jgi:hypothetical protein
LKIHQAQMAVSDFKKYPEFKGNVASVDTRSYYRGGGAHYGGNAETYMLVGEGMGKAMAQLIQEMPKKVTKVTENPAVEVAVAPKPAAPKPPNLKKPIKVYLLSGQSNMVGMGAVNGNGTTNLDYLVNNAKKFPHLSDGAGGWSKRNDVFYISATTDHTNKYMSIDGMRRIGPEVQFGYLLGDHHDEMVLVLKIAQGNRSIAFDVMPPSSRVGFSKEGQFYKGWQYDDFVTDAHRVLDNLKKYYPDYQGQGYEVAGFCWWQGHKDAGISQRFYEKHLVNLIKDFRKEFKSPDMKAVVATVAFGGKSMSTSYLQILKAQMAVSDYKKYPDFKGNVASVDCRPFFRGGGAHYGANAETYTLVGDGLGRYMIKLLNNEPITYEPVDAGSKHLKVKKPTGPPPNEKKKVKVYVLMGQSNMVGMGSATGKHGADLPGTLETIIKKDKKFTHLMDENGDWTVRNDVFYTDLTNTRDAEWLTVGKRRGLGPELQFGHIMGIHHDEVVLVIKAAQGNRSISFDINPPSSRIGVPKTGTYYPGWQYDVFVANIHKTLDNLKEYYPDYKGQGYEISGFCWWQGHKDARVPTEIYEKHLVNLIKDLRKEFDAPKAPFSIATVGFEGKNMPDAHLVTLKAQMNVADAAKYPEFNGNVATYDIREFWREVQDSPREEGYHYHRNAETYCLVGDALGRNMIKLVTTNKNKEEPK